MNSLLKLKSTFPLILKKTLQHNICFKFSTKQARSVEKDINFFLNNPTEAQEESREEDEMFKQGNHVYFTNLQNRKREKMCEYFTEDEDLSPYFNEEDIETEFKEKLNFLKLTEKELWENLNRGDLNRRGSLFLLFLAEEISHRVNKFL